MGGFLEDNLARSVDEAEFVVDLSNVVRERSFGGPGARSLRRLHLLLQALITHTGDRDVRAYLVADESLLGSPREFPDQADVDRLRSWVAENLVEEVPDADERLLEIAGMTEIPVISGDTYVNHRDEHRWIQGNTWQFLQPVAGPNGTVVLTPLDMGFRSAAEISHRKEIDAFKVAGLLGPGRVPLIGILSRSWRCPDRRCTLYDVHRGNRVLPPRMYRGKPTCQIHGTTLIDNGPRPGMAQMKVVIDGLVAARFTLAEGSETRVGRNPQPGVSLYGLVDPDVAGRVSREHVLVVFERGRVTVRDVSTYGSRMRRAGKRGQMGEWETMPRGAERPFRPGDEVELAPGVVITRSGRRFPDELPGAWQNSPLSSPPSAPGATATTLRS